MSSQRPIPHVPPQTEQEVHRWMSAVKEVVEANQGVRGDILDRVVTLKMLVDAGVLSEQAAKNMARG